MTAAQIREAARLLDKAHEPDDRIVTFMELGSEGCVYIVGTWMDRGPRTLIARDGHSTTEVTPAESRP